MFLNVEFCTLYATSEQDWPHVKEEYVGTICYEQKVEIWHESLTFLEGTEMLRKYSKISIFNILKTSLSLKMANAYISNDMIIMLYLIIILSIV